MTRPLPPPEPGPGGARRRLHGLLDELHDRLGHAAYVEACRDLLGGVRPVGSDGGSSRAPRREHPDLLPWLTGLAAEDLVDPHRFGDDWLRVWGARGLLHHWDEAAGPDVVAGLADPAWRVAEGCLRVAARHEVAGAGPGAAALLGHDLPRVRAAALRVLATAGDTEHAASVEACEDDPDESVRRQAATTRAALAERLDLPR